MSLKYLTAEKEAHYEQIIEKSRFIAHVFPVSTREEADEKLRQVRAEYKDATHNVPAFVIGEKAQLQWASDDGEPQGTSGAPIVQLICSMGLTNVLVVVTRYFGGIKLGTGGLVRAYTSSAKLALAAAGIRRVCTVRTVVFDMAYNLLGRLRNMEGDVPFKIEGIEYSDRLRVTLCYEPENEALVMPALSDLTGGKLSLISTSDADL